LIKFDMSLLRIFDLLLPVFGIILGSFVGAFHHRKISLQNKEDIIFKRSRCDICKKKLAIWELVPIMSYLLLKGRCYSCKSIIPRQYLIIEILFFIISINILFLPLNEFEAYIVLVLIGLLIIQAISDFEKKELFTLASILIALFGINLSIVTSIYSTLSFSVIGMVAGFLCLYLLNKIYYLFKKKDGIGSGDFLLFGATLAIHGIEMFGPMLLIASSITLGIGYYTSSLHKEMPLGTGLAIAGIIFLLMPF